MRDSDPRADSVFQALDDAEDTFVFLESSDSNCPSDVCYFDGFSWGGGGVGADKRIPDLMAHLVPGETVIGAAHVRGRPRYASEGIGATAYHEAVHLIGILQSGQKNSDCSRAFVGVPGARQDCPRGR
jgi:hypothetical protein